MLLLGELFTSLSLIEDGLSNIKANQLAMVSFLNAN